MDTKGCISDDVRVLRGLARQYAEIAAKPVQAERRDMWTGHFSLKKTRPPVLATYGMWNVWCREVFADERMQCKDSFYRDHERWFRMQIFQDAINDDFICEPWITQHAVHKTRGGIYGEPWGMEPRLMHTGEEGGAWKSEPPIQRWEDTSRLVPPVHAIDEEATGRNVQRLQDALGDILEVDVNRGPVLNGFAGDISTTVAALRGLEQLMLDMYESPDELHRLLAFLRDGILANQQEAEDAGDFSLTTQNNQAMPYAKELERPEPGSGPRKRKALWGFCAAQEYTLISPEFHEEFLFQYQMPIMEKYGLVHYGCCEDLTHKIAMLRKLRNLRSIAVTPAADVAQSAEQIGTDYVISWRPNPTDMVCAGWDEARVKKQIRDGMEACRGGVVHIHLKDIETVQGEPERLARWVRIVRDISDEF